MSEKTMNEKTSSWAPTPQNESSRNEKAPVPEKGLGAASQAALRTSSAQDLIPQANQKSANVLSVGQLNLQIKQILEGSVGKIWVRGEISNLKVHSSGHMYFSLKDSDSQINAVMFKGFSTRVKFPLKDGVDILAFGRVSVYEARGNYSLYVENMEPLGAGALQRAFEQLRDQLKAEGLFDPRRKKQIPRLPRHVAIVTSKTGAAIRDILNILSRRAPHIQVTVIDALVQGEAAAPSIIEGLRKAALLKDVDAVIVGRGGGSIEDLWAFNNEALARFISEYSLPVISAVGHEIDFTICDFVADLRAPTPSAAAELVSESSQALIKSIETAFARLKFALKQKLSLIRETLKSSQKRLIDPKQRLNDLMFRNDDLMNRLELAIQSRLSFERNHLSHCSARLRNPMDLVREKQFQLSQVARQLTRSLTVFHGRLKDSLERKMAVLDSVSPLKVVARGYAIISTNESSPEERKLIRSVKQVKSGDQLILTLHDGQLNVDVP
jgi:exodeoxyribonuclease VII large subunit